MQNWYRLIPAVAHNLSQHHPNQQSKVASDSDSNSEIVPVPFLYQSAKSFDDSIAALSWCHTECIYKLAMLKDQMDIIHAVQTNQENGMIECQEGKSTESECWLIDLSRVKAMS